MGFVGEFFGSGKNLWAGGCKVFGLGFLVKFYVSGWIVDGNGYPLEDFGARRWMDFVHAMKCCEILGDDRLKWVDNGG